MSEHTKGPWVIKGGKTHANEIVGKSKTGKEWVIARTTAAKVGRSVDDANARLIAASPELLEALIAVGDGYQCFCGREGEDTGHSAACKMARDAIARAQGLFS